MTFPISDRGLGTKSDSESESLDGRVSSVAARWSLDWQRAYPRVLFCLASKSHYELILWLQISPRRCKRGVLTRVDVAVRHPRNQPLLLSPNSSHTPYGRLGLKMASNELEKLELLSLVNSITQELVNHTGLSGKSRLIALSL